MKQNYLSLLFILFILFGSCGKSDPAKTIDPDPPKTEEPDEEVSEISIEKAVFTDPATVAKGTASNVIRDELIRYLDGASKGSTVHVNIYLMDDDAIINAIIRAHVRGVKMNVMIDNSRDTPQKQNVGAIRALNSALFGDSRLIVVDSDLKEAPDNGSIDHHKHILFSEVVLKEGRAKNVVFSTSHNFITAAPKRIQDGVILSDENLYNVFLENWESIASKANGGMRDFVYRIYNSADNKVTAYFFPRIKDGVWDGEDTVIEILDKISDFENTTIQVGMSDWSNSRVNTAKKLTELQAKGAKVEVIAKAAAGNLVQNELAIIKDKGGYVNIFQSPHNIHSKFMLINGTWDGKKQTVLICGTHNFTPNALHLNNELILILKDSPLFKDYHDNFEKIKASF